MVIPKAPIKRGLRESKGLRVSDDTVEYLQKYLTSLVKEIGADASEVATHAGRVTIKPEDVEVALSIGY